MPLKRKSCDACFKGRRRCDLGYPSCETCRRTRKPCRYTVNPTNGRAGGRNSDSASQSGSGSNKSSHGDSSFSEGNGNKTLESLLESLGSDALQASDSLVDFSFAPTSTPSDPRQTSTSRSLSLVGSPPPNLVGLLGDLQPIEGSSQTWQWVIDQLKSYPRELAHQAGNMFIHKQLYREVMPPSMRSAFGVSSMYSLINDSNRASLFRILDAEVFALLELSEDSSLLDELARLQALVLYQTIRLFHGGVEQRFTAEQQQSLVMSWAMKLLSRAEAELRHLESEKYTSWMLAESIRRTALVVYMLYGVNSIVREGFCVGFPTLSKLPVSTTPTYWDSEAAYRVCTESASVTLTYENFTDLWLVSTPKTLQPLEKFLLIPCKGLDIVELYSNTEMLEA